MLLRVLLVLLLHEFEVLIGCYFQLQFLVQTDLVCQLFLQLNDFLCLVLQLLLQFVFNGNEKLLSELRQVLLGKVV